MRKNGLQVAIDGPASAGKSTVAKRVAKQFHYIYCDTGAMYRAITLQAIRQGVSFDDVDEIGKIVHASKITFEPSDDGQKVFIDGKEITEAIRQEDVTNSVSAVAAIGEVRKQLSAQQQEIAKDGGIVMDGRDIGTAVLPDAEVKIFLIASVAERAQRRYKENIQKGINTPLDELQLEIEARDYKDSHRKISPLTKAKDAVEIDTTSLSIDQVVSKIADVINKTLK
ncbi:(d)CMP kinase [Lentilactobacillus buchneri]|uniref:Cytidylate kinase n=2 Tax=Lentilactobacillus buchneri TaxID=1581 RepID=J9W7L8_LENBU|nr:(d)CMP kinase [Lentilactobacillus buchneri]MCC6100322.1 (d)CMP kinase [Lactobacillus sp.]WCJ51728.1 (d)CMP kinase [Lentilactobacillus sp. Egmn17]AEB73300.1 Cytidylate kinase [Lentilactobacillus buchneri NRRL B-30929]AFS00216.1 Cytidylate kinase [Lentilactobacillus buchneri subsp. silagei CD034]KRK69738.1 cytidylate kinase [Lentilactobacillus buchneri DSM 20057]